jgi:hypothetical protein
MTTTAQHIAAKAVVERALPGTPASESLYLRAVAAHENGYGTTGSWGGSNNWGCLTGSGDLGSIDHADSRPNKDGTNTTYVTKFRKYSTPERGAIGLAGTLFKRLTRAAILKGDLLAAAAAQYGYGYYTGYSTNSALAVASYARSLQGHIATIRAATGEADQFGTPAATESAVRDAWARLLRGSPSLGASLSSGVLRAIPDDEQSKLATAYSLGGVINQVTPPLTPATTPDVHYGLVDLKSGRQVATTAYNPNTSTWKGWSRT